MSQTKQRDYKATIILDTRGYEEPVETLIEKVSKTLSDLGANVSSTENLGRIDFVRVTNPKHTGDSYIKVEFSAEPGVPGSFHETVRLDRTIKRVVIESK